MDNFNISFMYSYNSLKNLFVCDKVGVGYIVLL